MQIVKTNKSIFRIIADGVYTWAFKGTNDVINNGDGDLKKLYV